jgi:hypothetical protein
MVSWDIPKGESGFRRMGKRQKGKTEFRSQKGKRK